MTTGYFFVAPNSICVYSCFWRNRFEFRANIVAKIRLFVCRCNFVLLLQVFLSLDRFFSLPMLPKKSSHNVVKVSYFINSSEFRKTPVYRTVVPSLGSYTRVIIRSYLITFRSIVTVNVHLKHTSF